MFSFSAATSCYFEDPSGNIVEFIARTHDNDASDVPFCAASIQRLSEMSVVVHNAVDVAAQLRAIHIVERSDATVTNTSLAFMNDQKSSVSLLLTTPQRKWLFSTKVSNVFPIRITLSSGHVLGVNDALQFYV